MVVVVVLELFVVVVVRGGGCIGVVCRCCGSWWLWLYRSCLSLLWFVVVVVVLELFVVIVVRVGGGCIGVV